MKPGAHLFKHGMTGTPEHNVWRGMLTRCHGSNPARDGWHLYQGAGIKVCERWRQSFADFFADMGPRPTPKHSIERIDSTKNYQPDNCIWATRQQQARNTTRNRFLTRDGRTLTLVEWAGITGLKRETIAGRLDRGWTVDRALSTPKISLRNLPRQRGERGRYSKHHNGLGVEHVCPKRADASRQRAMEAL